MFRELMHDIARQSTPVVEVSVVPGSFRWNVIDGLPDAGNIGIELGVAAGSFSKRMVDSGKFRTFFGVDVYGDGHDVRQYKTALKTVGILADYRLLRMTFAEALDLFDDGFFDFIYVDGYAHTGEEGGRTMLDWYAKLKPGGIMAGDDYDAERWPLVVWGANNLVHQLGLPLQVTEQLHDANYNRFPSWFFTKPLDGVVPKLTHNPELVRLGEMEKQHKQALAKEARIRKRKAKDTPAP
jgi:hypothetical protein